MDFYELDVHMRELTPHRLKLVQAVYESEGEWLTRAMLARSIGKRRLTPYDIRCLKQLSDKGLIITSKRPTNAPGSDFAYIYNMTEAVADSIQKWSERREAEANKRKRKPVNLVGE